MVASKYALRAIFDDQGVSHGWEVVEIKAEHEGTCYGVRVGEVHNPLMGISSATIMQYIVSSLADKQRFADGPSS